MKLEGGVTIAEHVRRIVDAGIPVMGHVGLTPQSVHAFGGFRVQGKEEDAAARVLQDAKSLEQACVPGPEHSFGMATPNCFGMPAEARPVVAQVPPAYGQASDEAS